MVTITNDRVFPRGSGEVGKVFGRVWFGDLPCEKGASDGVFAVRQGTSYRLPLHPSSRHNHALRCSTSLPAVPAVVVMMAPAPMTVPIIAIVMMVGVSPVPMRVPVVSRYQDRCSLIYHGRGIDDHRLRGHDNRCGCDDNRQPNAHGDTDSGVGRQGQGKTGETQERTQTNDPQQRYRFHDGISFFVFSQENRRTILFISCCTGIRGGVQTVYEG
jgi:hypothetical protein